MNTINDKIKNTSNSPRKNRNTTFLSAIYIPMTAISKPQRFTIKKPSTTAFWHILFLATLGATALNTKSVRRLYGRRKQRRSGVFCPSRICYETGYVKSIFKSNRVLRQSLRFGCRGSGKISR